jgi:hypothetical protein
MGGDSTATAWPLWIGHHSHVPEQLATAAVLNSWPQQPFEAAALPCTHQC